MRAPRAKPPADPPFVRELRRDLRARLAELDRDRALIRRALAALDEGSQRAPRQRRPERELALEAIRRDPGVRTSMLGLSLGLPATRLSDVLADMERGGLIERLGLGWATSTRDEAAPI